MQASPANASPSSAAGESGQLRATTPAPNHANLVIPRSAQRMRGAISNALRPALRLRRARLEAPWRLTSRYFLSVDIDGVDALVEERDHSGDRRDLRRRVLVAPGDVVCRSAGCRRLPVLAGLTLVCTGGLRLRRLE